MTELDPSPALPLNTEATPAPSKGDLQNSASALNCEQFTSEEAEANQKLFGAGRQAVQFTKLHCTSCAKHLGSAGDQHDKRKIHPLLKVLMCLECYNFYGSGEFSTDEDGSELYCRWCGQGGKVLCCAKCQYVFCQQCIRRNLGKKKLTEVKESDDWLCFACEPIQLVNLRVTCKALFTYANLLIEKSKNDPEILKIDYSMCCQVKPKKKRPLSPDLTYIPNLVNIESLRKKIKLNVTKENEKEKEKEKVWEAEEQDEVVCTPDLMALMDEDEATPPSPPVNKETHPELMQLVNSCPPLHPINPMLGNKPTYIRVLPVTSHTPQGPIILNGTTGRPLTTFNVQKKIFASNAITFAPPLRSPIPQRPPPPQRPPMQQRAPILNKVLMKVTQVSNKGSRNEWFDTASKLAISINQTLISRMKTLEGELLANPRSFRDITNVHNQFQELLNNTISTLSRIRQNLRTDFVRDINKSKLPNPMYNPCLRPPPTSFDNDVIFVEPEPIPTICLDPGLDLEDPICEVAPDSTREINQPSSELQKCYLKVKPFSELLAENSVPKKRGLTEPDSSVLETSELAGKPEVVEKPKVAEKPEVVGKPVVVQKPEVEKSTKEVSIYEATPEFDAEFFQQKLCPETLNMIRKALIESRFEQLLNDNVKSDVVNVPVEDLKRMLSVTVMPEQVCQSTTVPVRSVAQAEDIEAILSKSILIKGNLQKTFYEEDIEEAITNCEIEQEVPVTSNSDVTLKEDKLDVSPENLTTDSGIETDVQECIKTTTDADVEKCFKTTFMADSEIAADVEKCLKTTLTDSSEFQELKKALSEESERFKSLMLAGSEFEADVPESLNTALTTNSKIADVHGCSNGIETEGQECINTTA